jgi:hypothetical protein
MPAPALRRPISDAVQLAALPLLIAGHGVPTSWGWLCRRIRDACVGRGLAAGGLITVLTESDRSSSGEGVPGLCECQPRTGVNVVVSRTCACAYQPPWSCHTFAEQCETKSVGRPHGPQLQRVRARGT